MNHDRAWVLLKSGQRLDLLNPHPHAWTDDDIATALARTYRWGGHSRWDLPLSVAQHSITVLHIREMQAGRKLTAAERLRELAHDMDEGLLGYDALTPLKPHLGEGYARIVQRLQKVIDRRYELPRWDRESYAAHKRVDRLAAASEAYHVVGWPAADIRNSLGILIEPLDADPLAGLTAAAAWEPWAPRVATDLYLGLLRDLQRDMFGLAGPAAICVVPSYQAAEWSPDRSWVKPTFVSVEGGDTLSIEGWVVKGVRDEDGTWDLDGRFTVQTEEGELFHVNGWCCDVQTR